MNLLTSESKRSILQYMKRTDVHSPSNLVTESYEFAYAYDGHPEEGDRAYCQTLLNLLLADGWRFGQVHGGDTCDHCGTHLRYVAVMKHLPTRTLIKIGEQCLDNRFSLATDEFQRLRKAAALNRERMKKSVKMEKFLSVEDNAAAYAFLKDQVEEKGNYGYNGFYFDLLHKANRYAELSEKQVAAALKAKARDEEFDAKKAAEQEILTDVVEGKQSIAGKIVSVKNQPGFQGEFVTKMLVMDDRNFKIWAPSRAPSWTPLGMPARSTAAGMTWFPT